MELELIEPSFYFDTDPLAVDLFADRLVDWLQQRVHAGPAASGG